MKTGEQPQGSLPICKTGVTRMAEAKDDIVLSIRGMCKSFGRNRVLDHINLDVKRGTVMGLMGENGAGKSTMMKCLFGTYQKDEGKIFLNGKEISFSGPKDALENGIAMVHQELNQCLERSVIDNLFLGRYPVNSMGVVDEGQMKKKAADLFRKLGMTVNLTQPMRNMSVSQRQMCEIAKAISYNAQVIVLDEPTAMLDPNGRKEVLEAVHQLNRQENVTVVLITHYMEEVIDADRVVVMDDGHVVMEGTPKEIFSQVETLKKYRLDVPQVTLLAHELKQSGVDIPDGILTTEELVNALCQ